MSELERLRAEILRKAEVGVRKSAEEKRSLSPIEERPPKSEDGIAEEVAWAIVAVASALIGFASAWFMIGQWK